MASALKGWAVSSLGSLMLLLPSASLFALDSSYIDAVEADVAEFASGAFTPPENSTWLGGATDEDSAQLDDLEGFSSFIQQKSPGSYIFYKKLPTEYQEKLQKEYLTTGDLDRVKEDIFKYTRQIKN